MIFKATSEPNNSIATPIKKNTIYKKPTSSKSFIKILNSNSNLNSNSSQPCKCDIVFPNKKKTRLC